MKALGRIDFKKYALSTIIYLMQSSKNYQPLFTWCSHLKMTKLNIDWTSVKLMSHCEKLKNDKVEKWQKLTAGLNINHMHIFKPSKKDVQSCMKKELKLYKELYLQGTHCLYTFIKSEVKKWGSEKSNKN